MKYKCITPLLTLFTVFFFSTLYTKSACIIIHGTWAKNESWYQPGGDFFHEIEMSNHYLNIVDEIISFSWSGKLGDLAQIEAGEKLAKTILEYDSVILIGHSHGVTVGILASMSIGKNNSHGKFSGKIKKFYALGVPVDSACKIYPDMSVIGTFYNLFSFGDMIQTVHGLYERCFKKHKNITNIAIQFNDIHPNHSQLHHPAIGKHLLAIPDFYKEKEMGSFEKFENDHPAEIFFFYHKIPLYDFQDDQTKKLEVDKIAFELMLYAFFK